MKGPEDLARALADALPSFGVTEWCGLVVVETRGREFRAWLEGAVWCIETDGHRVGWADDPMGAVMDWAVRP